MGGVKLCELYCDTGKGYILILYEFMSYLFFQVIKASSSKPLLYSMLEVVVYGIPIRPIRSETRNLLVNPSGLGGGVLEDLGRLEPESNLLLGVLDGVGTVADVAADILIKLLV